MRRLPRLRIGQDDDPVVVQLTEDTLSSVLRTTSSFFTGTARGELLQRCTQDTRVIQRFGLSILPGFVQELLLACLALAVIGRWNGLLATMLVAAYVILFIPVHVYGRKRSRARAELVAHDARLRQSLLEKLETAKQIKLYGAERREYGMRPVRKSGKKNRRFARMMPKIPFAS